MAEAGAEWSLPAVLDVVTAAAPHRDMLVWTSLRRTYAEVQDRTRRLAAFLRVRGLGLQRERAQLDRWACGQSRVALVLSNCPAYVEAMIGAYRARAVPYNVNHHYNPREVGALILRVGADAVVPLSTLLRRPELEAQLGVAGVTHLALARSFRGRSYLDDVAAVAPGLPFLRRVWAVDDPPAPAVAGALVAALEDAVRPADDLVVLFTSGSRGAPKGTVHTHGGGLRAVAAGLAARCVGPDDRLYIPMPFFWTGGLASGLLTALVAGATLLTEAAPEPERTLALLARERATLFRGWPDQASRLASHPGFAAADLASLGPGSLPAVLPPAQRPAPGARANLFGMTETFGPYCGARLDVDLPPGARGSCGRPFAGVEVRVADPATGAPLAPGEIGEIGVRGPHVMRALCGRTRDATFDAAGWYPTGARGALDADGYLWYHGRLDDMFKVRGATVYPAEVEAALRMLDGVRHAHVTNVPGSGGDAVGALVVTDATRADLVAGAGARLSAFKVPTCWVVTASAADVPVTATGKVDKAALQALLQAREGSPA